MNQMQPTESGGNSGHEEELEIEVLIGCLVDGEATEEDRSRFDLLAASEPSLWRQLALRQREMDLLAEQVMEETSTAVWVDLPRRWLVPSRLSWPMALSGWAALIIVAISWSMMAFGSRGTVTGSETIAEQLSPEEHYTRYLNAPYVLGEMEPEVVDVEELSDGRVAVRFIRRSEEVTFLDPEGELPVDEDGGLTKDPGKLRTSEPAVGMP